jgi:hypothetical protein
MRNFKEKLYRQSKRTLGYPINSFSEKCAVYEIMLKNLVEPDRPMGVHLLNNMASQQ